MLNSLKTLFQKAKEKDEFNFVCTLIDYRGMGSVRYIANLPEWFDAIEYYKSIYQNEEDLHKKLRIGLLIYSTFFESNDLYNLLGNLARNVLGYRGASHLYWKHNKADRWLGTAEKVSLITEIISDVGSVEIAGFFNETHHKQIRNSFFHSSYSLEGDEFYLKNSEPIYINNIGTHSLSITNFIFPRIEGVLEFFQAFKSEYTFHFKSYAVDIYVKGKFPIEMDIKILGSDDGLYGFETQTSYVKKENDFWTAMNIIFDNPDETTRFIGDEIRRFISKETIRGDDGSLQQLHEVISERDRDVEKKNLGIIYQRFGDLLYKRASEEQNHFKQIDLNKRALSYYQKMLNIDQNRRVTNDIACLKYSVGIDSNNNDLLKESLLNFLECIKIDSKANPIKNGLRLIIELEAKGIEVAKEKVEFIRILKQVNVAELDELKQKTLIELGN